MSARVATTSSEPRVAEAAREMLPQGGAVDAIVAGVLAAAALSPSVLLGPVQILVGGAGVGARAVDGRVRQPGRSAPRPRGSREGEAIPDAARVGAPALPAALVAAHGAFGLLTLARASAPARALAKGTPRAAVIDAFAGQGAGVLASLVAPELVPAAGRSVGGLVTHDDLRETRPELAAADAREGGVHVVPWLDEALDATPCRLLCVADSRGVVAVACWEEHHDGVDLPPIGLRAPLVAVPVLRGVPRLPPGTPLPAASPLALVAHDGVVDVALGLEGPGDLARALDLAAASVLAPTPEAPPGARLLAVARGARGVRAIHPGA
jgi:gamma-glutamyltranspeptidase/glutathione hydrolase